MITWIKRILLIIIAGVLMAAVFFLFLSGQAAANARRAEKDGRPEAALVLYEESLRYNPFDAGVHVAAARLLMRGVKKSHDPEMVLQRAESYFAGAEALNSHCVECALGYAYIDLTRALKAPRTKRDGYIARMLTHLEAARRLDPNGVNTLFSSAEIMAPLWPVLNKAEREIQLERYARYLRQRPWESRRIYVKVWPLASDWDMLRRITPDTLVGHRQLMDFAAQQGLWPHYLEERSKVAALKKAVGLTEKEKQQQIKDAARRERLKVLLEPVASETILRKNWMGTDSVRPAKNGNIYWNTGIEGVVRVADGASRLVIRAKGTPTSGGWPLMAVSVDGEETAVVFVDSLEEKEYVTALPPRKKGLAVIGVKFLNDGSDKAKGEDRNLFVSEAKVE